MGKTSDNLQDKLRSVARQNRHTTRDPAGDNTGGATLTTHNNNNTIDNSNSGGLNEKDGVGYPSASGSDRSGSGDGLTAGGGGAQAATGKGAQDGVSQSTHSTTPPTVKSEVARAGDSSVESPDGADTATATKLPMTTRTVQASKRFLIHTKNALCHSWINVLLVFVPVGIAAEAAHMSPSIVFALNAVAIVPLAGLLSHATESVASRLGDTIGALLNVTFGNAVELIIFIIALAKNEIRIVQASILGSILANLLLILGMAFLLGGLRFREQVYNSTVTNMSACLLSLCVMSLLLPTAFHASFKEEKADAAQTAVLAVSRGTSVILLLVYGIYLLFQLKTHAYMYESVPQAIIEAESHPGILADMMDSSSSSSDSSSSSSDSDSDSSGDSGSVKNARRRFKRMIKHRRHRKSSVSTASVSSPSASFPSALSSAATTMERQDGNPWEHALASSKSSRRMSALAPATNDDANLDADVETGNHNTRVRDFGDANGGDVTKALESKRSHKKGKKHRKQKDAIELSEKPPVETIEPVRSQSGPRVGFAEEISTAESQIAADSSAAKRPFNMRGFSRTPAFRPGLTKMLSNNVFATPPPPPSASQNPVPTLRGRPMIRRTNSLPGRLNQLSVLAGVNPAPTPTRSGTDPISPFQHQVGDEEAGVETVTSDGKLVMSRTAAVVMLLFSTALVAVCAEFLVEAIPEMVDDSPVSEAFIGLIILPIVGNAAEHVTAVTVAAKNKMDLAIGVAVGSSIQIALFVTPVVVLLGWILNTEMSLYFNLFETISLFATVFVVNFLVLDGRSNYLEGTLLIAAYVIIAICAFYYPDADSLSSVGGGEGS